MFLTEVTVSICAYTAKKLSSVYKKKIMYVGFCMQKPQLSFALVCRIQRFLAMVTSQLFYSCVWVSTFLVTMYSFDSLGHHTSIVVTAPET
jgi:hypothetical protein